MTNSDNQRNPHSPSPSWATGRRLGWWVAVALWLLVIFLFSAQDGDSSGSISQNVVQMIYAVFGSGGEGFLDFGGGSAWLTEHAVRKCAHAAEYSILALLLFKALGGFSALHAIGRRYAVTLVALFCCAGLDEFHQTFLPGRTGQFSDVVLDTVAAAVVLGVILLVAHAATRRRA